MNNDDYIDFERIALTCPITTRKILQPYYIENQPSYEYIAAMEKITS